MIRLLLAVAVTAALSALGGAVGFAILIAHEPTPAEQSNALRGVVALAIVRRFWR